MVPLPIRPSKWRKQRAPPMHEKPTLVPFLILSSAGNTLLDNPRYGANTATRSTAAGLSGKTFIKFDLRPNSTLQKKYDNGAPCRNVEWEASSQEIALLIQCGKATGHRYRAYEHTTKRPHHLVLHPICPSSSYSSSSPSQANKLLFSMAPERASQKPT